MTGMSGVLGRGRGTLERVTNGVRWSDRETGATYEGDGVGVHVTDHASTTGEQPARAGDALVWLVGEVYGFEDGDGYRPRPPRTDGAAFCASLYERHGLAFLEGLNGSFAGVVYDRDAEEVSVFVDRFGSRPVFCTRTGGEFVFSTGIQTLTDHPGVDPAFDPEYLLEYLTFRRSFGVRTPLRGIEEFHPASVTTYDLATDSVERSVYWEPRYRPTDEPFDAFLDRFVETFRTVIDERLEREGDYGLLLSGGSDSRLVLAAADRPITAFHLSDWRSDETRTAERIAETAGADFRLLQRTDGYYGEMLGKNAALSNFDGYFFQGYLTPFEDEVVGSVDALLSGLYADTLFKSTSLPTRSLSLGRLGTLSLPYCVDVTSTGDVVDKLIAGRDPSPPAYLDVEADLRDVLARNVTRRDGRIDYHGVTYDSLDELVVSNHYYPLSNDTELIYMNSLRQLCPSRTPFLDNRLVDLHLTMPTNYRLRRNLIGEAVRQIDPELAEIPHASTGVAISRSFPRQYLARQGTALRRKYLSFLHAPPEASLEHGSWRDHAEYLRHEDFVIDAIRDHGETVDALPLLDRDGVETTYRRHLDGENRTAELFTLLTLLEMPVTEAVAGEDDGTPAEARIDVGCRQ